MGKRYRLLALDLDGTLLTDDKTITLKTKESIQKAVNAGVQVVFATGRGIQTAGKYWKELGLMGPMVFVNGAEVWKSPQEIRSRTLISKEDIYKLQQLVVHSNAWYWGYHTGALVHQEDWPNQLYEKDWLKFGIGSDDLDIIKKLWNEIECWGTLEVTQSAPNNLEISRKGVTKETGIKEVCKLLGIGMEEVIAVGDSMNDFALIRSAGLGVAMGNAQNELKRVADVITATNQQDGVEKVINQYLINQFD